jgi:hypothetical protein
MPLIKLIRLEALMTHPPLLVATRVAHIAMGLLAVMLFSGCDQLGIETPAKLAAAVESEGKAVGSACRHAGRAIEDCFTLNPKANKSAVFGGWREMNDYMTKNKIDVVTPQIAQKTPANKDKAAKQESHEEAAATSSETATPSNDHSSVAAEPARHRKHNDVAQADAAAPAKAGEKAGDKAGKPGHDTSHDVPRDAPAASQKAAPPKSAAAVPPEQVASAAVIRPSHRVIAPPVSESEVEMARQRAHTP